MIAVIIENLGAWTARAGWTHPPKVVVSCDTDDPVIRQTCNFLPKIGSFVIRVIDSDQQLFCRNIQLFGYHFPSVWDGLFFEIIAKAKVAQHLKEREVAGCHANVIKIVVLTTGAHTFLAGRRTRVITGFNPSETVLELHHTRVCEHQGWVITRH